MDSECNICEEFIAFLKLNRIGAVDIADAIVQCLENLGLSLSELHGQGYDGASTISGHQVFSKNSEKSNPKHYTRTVLAIHLI